MKQQENAWQQFLTSWQCFFSSRECCGYNIHFVQYHWYQQEIFTGISEIQFCYHIPLLLFFLLSSVSHFPQFWNTEIASKSLLILEIDSIETILLRTCPQHIGKSHYIVYNKIKEAYKRIIIPSAQQRHYDTHFNFTLLFLVDIRKCP